MHYGIFNNPCDARLCIEAAIRIAGRSGRIPVSSLLSRACAPAIITVPDQQHHRMLRICFQS